jgi:predicted TIM-barrel enzyme
MSAARLLGYGVSDHRLLKIARFPLPHLKQIPVERGIRQM